jgi:TRAP-type C4-dicarboxylate transport system substrate-binding protein
VAEAIAFQRDLHEREEEDARRAIEAQECEIIELEPEQHVAFVKAVQPVFGEARRQYGDGLFELAPILGAW